MVGAASPLWRDMINGKIAEREGEAASVTIAFLFSIQRPLMLIIRFISFSTFRRGRHTCWGCHFPRGDFRMQFGGTFHESGHIFGLKSHQCWKLCLDFLSIHPRREFFDCGALTDHQTQYTVAVFGTLSEFINFFSGDVKFFSDRLRGNLFWD